MARFERLGGEAPATGGLAAVAPTAPRPDSRDDAYLQYIGFEQTANTRVYRFKRISRAETREFIVSVDLALFAKYRVAIQDGPFLSAHLLSSGAIQSRGATTPEALSLTEGDMLAHMARRPAPASKDALGRKPRPALELDV